MKKTITILLASSIFTPVLAFADNSQEVVITASRKPQSINKVGQSISVLNAEDIKSSQAIQIPELLRSIPGVTVTRTGGPGNAVSVKLRGAQSYQTVAMVDGVKLSDPSALQCDFNLGTLMVGNIERIEVVRGAQSVLWGSQAIGGVINMITKAPTQKLNANLQGEYGTYNTQNYVGNISGKIGNLSASLGANYFDTNGYSSFTEWRGGKEKDGAHNFGANTKLKYEFSDIVSLNLMGFYTDSDGEFDNFGSDALNTQSAKIGIGYIGLNADAFDGKLQNQLGYSYTKTNRSYYYPSFSSRYNYEGKVDRYNYQGNLNLADYFGVVFGAESEKFDYLIDSGFSKVTKDMKTDSLFIQANANPIKPLNIAAGLRNEHHNLYGDHLVFDINGSYALNNGATIIRAAYGEGYRAPSLYELYDAFSGNQALVPESSQSKDISISHQFIKDKLSGAITYFDIKSDNLIAWSGKYMNVDKAKSNGFEFEVKYAPIKNLKLVANYTQNDAIDAKTNKNLARRPKDSANLIADYAFDNGFKIGANITHVGNSFDNASNTILTKGYTIGDLRASYKISDLVELFGRIENITDKRYETVYKYGTSGRALYAGVRIGF